MSRVRYIVPDGPDIGREFVIEQDPAKGGADCFRYLDNGERQPYNETFRKRCEVPWKAEEEPTKAPAGRKDDSGKTSWRLFYKFLPEMDVVIKVLEHGAKKYADHNWIHVENGVERYGEAARRHILDSLDGEELDKDSGLPHEFHAIVDLFMRAARKRLGK